MKKNPKQHTTKHLYIAVFNHVAKNFLQFDHSECPQDRSACPSQGLGNHIKQREGTFLSATSHYSRILLRKGVGKRKILICSLWWQIDLPKRLLYCQMSWKWIRILPNSHELASSCSDDLQIYYPVQRHTKLLRLFDLQYSFQQTAFYQPLHPSCPLDSDW